MSHVLKQAGAEPGNRLGAVLAALARNPSIAIAIGVALGICAPFFIYPVFLMNALCFTLFASAFNLLMGYAGLLSFGHAAFFGIAAYATAYSMKTLGVPVEVGILAGTACATLMGAVFGALAIRRKGIAFAMVTLALAQMVYFYALQNPLFGGEDGIQSVPRGKLLGFLDLDNTMVLYFFVFAMTLLGLAIIRRTVHSPFGYVLNAIRQNEPRAISLGYKTDHYKFIAFVLSAGLSGLAGSLQTLVFQIASLTGIHWAISGDAILMTILGGTATLLGPIVGAFTILAMSNYLTQFGSWVTVIQGAVFIVCVLAFRAGIVGELDVMLRRIMEKSR